MTSLLTEAEMRRLSTFLDSGQCGDQALHIDELHGLLAAIACYPKPIGLEEWLGIVFDGQPRFDDTDQSSDITDLVMRFHETVADDLYQGHHFLPLFSEMVTGDGAQQLHPGGWCRGFIAGMNLRKDEWLGRLDNDLGRLVSPIIALAVDQSSETPQELNEELRGELVDRVPECVGAIHAYWQGVLEREYKCPCGSGRTFDQCCGKGSRTLH